MRIDLQCPPQRFRCSLIVTFVHGFRSLCEVAVQLYFLGSWGRCVARYLRLSCHTMHDQHPHGTDSQDLPGAHLLSHTPNSNPLIDYAGFQPGGSLFAGTSGSAAIRVLGGARTQLPYIGTPKCFGITTPPYQALANGEWRAALSQLGLKT